MGDNYKCKLLNEEESKSSVKIIKNTSPPKNIENQKFKKENIVDKEIDKK